MKKEEIWFLTLLQVGWIMACPCTPASHKVHRIILLLAAQGNLAVSVPVLDQF